MKRLFGIMAVIAASLCMSCSNKEERMFIVPGERIVELEKDGLCKKGREGLYQILNTNVNGINFRDAFFMYDSGEVTEVAYRSVYGQYTEDSSMLTIETCNELERQYNKMSDWLISLYGDTPEKIMESKVTDREKWSVIKSRKWNDGKGNSISINLMKEKIYDQLPKDGKQLFTDLSLLFIIE